MTQIQKVEKGSFALLPGTEIEKTVISAEERLIPKILAIQHTSDKAKDKHNDAEPGQMRDTVENKLFGEVGKPFEFIPFAHKHFWSTYNMQKGGQGEFIQDFPINAGNSNLKKEELVDGVPIKRVKTYEFYILIPSELNEGNGYPYVLSFRSTSYRGGQVLLSQFEKNQLSELPPWGVVCDLVLSEDSNDKGDFFVQSVVPKRVVDQNEHLKANQWYLTFKQGKAGKVDDSDTRNYSEETPKAKQDKF